MLGGVASFVGQKLPYNTLMSYLALSVQNTKDPPAFGASEASTNSLHSWIPPRKDGLSRRRINLSSVSEFVICTAENIEVVQKVVLKQLLID